MEHVTSADSIRIEVTDPFEEVFRLAAEDVSLIHGAIDLDALYAGGGDLDCVVSGLDPLWPLRIGASFQLVNRLRYDVTGTSWFLTGPTGGAILDTLEDPEGIGKYGFRTRDIGGEGRVAPGPAAAYLALKRLRKADARISAWKQVADLAASDLDGFRLKLIESLPRNGAALADAVLGGAPPERHLRRKAVFELRFGRLVAPVRCLRFLAKQVGRIKDRVLHRTGSYVLIVGPDGTGKSTIARSLGQEHFGFRRSEGMHWRPGILPGARATSSQDHSDPHDAIVRGRLASTAVLMYHWLDFVLGSALRIFPARRRSTLVVAERGWWDLAVDPRRYRLDVRPGLVEFLGRFVAKPDLVLRLTGSPADIVKRKNEIGIEEVDRQLAKWEEISPRIAPTVAIDTGIGEISSFEAAREAIMRAASDRAIASLGKGWFAIPRKGEARWWIPRGPRKVAQAAFNAWSPTTESGARGWRLGGMAAGVGAGRVFRRVSPPGDVIDLIGPHLGRGETVAISKGNHPGRHLVLIVSPDGEVRRVAKVVTSGDLAPLENEAEAISTFARHLPAPLEPPTLLESSPGVLVFEAVPNLKRKQAWFLPVDVAEAMGAFRAELGVAHGDFAPWNLLGTETGAWKLIDWESSHRGGEPFEDVLHYIFQGHALLGAPTADDLLRGVTFGRGWVGEALTGYARGAGISSDEAPLALERYLIARSEVLSGRDPDVVKALAARSRLVDLLRSA